MKLDLAGITRAAWRSFRADVPILLPLAGLLLFLPQWAILLLVPEAPTFEGSAGPTSAVTMAWAEAYADWVTTYGVWTILAYVAALYAALVVLALYLDHRRPTLSTAARRGLALLLRYVLATILIALPAGMLLLLALPLGALMLILIVPVFYWLGRTMLTGAVIVSARPRVGAVAAIRRSLALTRGNGLALATMVAIVTFGGQLAAQLVLGLDGAIRSAHLANPVALALIDAAAALIAAAAGLALVMLQMTLYRVFVASKGI